MQFADPIDTWCDLDGLGGMSSATGSTSPMKVCLLNILIELYLKGLGSK